MDHTSPEVPPNHSATSKVNLGRGLIALSIFLLMFSPFILHFFSFKQGARFLTLLIPIGILVGVTFLWQGQKNNQTEGTAPLQQSPCKPALFRYSSFNFILGLSALVLIFPIYLRNIHTFDVHLFSKFFFIGTLIGGGFALFKLQIALRPYIKDGVMKEWEKKARKFSIVLVLLQLGFLWNSQWLTETICNYLLNPNIESCPSSLILVAGFFLGIFIADFLWILNWERSNHQKLYI